MDAAVDLPFALPTAVASIAPTTLYAPDGLFGSVAGDLFGARIAHTKVSIRIALVFVGLPFVVRTVQPVIAELEQGVEEASPAWAPRGSRRCVGWCSRPFSPRS